MLEGIRPVIVNGMFARTLLTAMVNSIRAH
jgi:hypothetical protein